MTGATHFPNGVEVGCLSANGSHLAGTAIGGGTLGATHFPHGIVVPFLTVRGVNYGTAVPGTPATNFPNGIDTPEVTFI